jgi:hypothetical protein
MRGVGVRGDVVYVRRVSLLVDVDERLADQICADWNNIDCAQVLVLVPCRASQLRKCLIGMHSCRNSDDIHIGTSTDR